MWIGIAVIVLGTADSQANAALFKNKAECLKWRVPIVQLAEDTEIPMAYSFQCYDAKKYLVIHNGKRS